MFQFASCFLQNSKNRSLTRKNCKACGETTVTVHSVTSANQKRSTGSSTRAVLVVSRRERTEINTGRLLTLLTYTVAVKDAILLI